MKHVMLIVLMLLSAASFAQAATMRVLFVGNSHTFYNDLPDLFRELSDIAGHVNYVDQSTFGGYSLAQHAVNATTLGKIAEGNWDLVILQEHSLYPTIEFCRDSLFYPACRELDVKIQASASHTAFFMTWGWEFGGAHCVGEHCSEDYFDYFAMQMASAEAYWEIATELDAFLVPVGSLWATALHEDPTSPLWSGDHYHPSPEGSYLAACVFFARIYNESPAGLGFYGDIEPERARFYQHIAAKVVTDTPENPPGKGLRLLGNYPNPFNPRTVVEFVLDAPEEVRFEIFDTGCALIDRVELGRLAAGKHHFQWDAKKAASGVYFCRLRAGARSDTRKITLLR